MTASQQPGREQEIRARASAATRCPEALVNGRLDGEHTWVGGSFTSIRCELCGFSRPRGERAEETIELLDEIAHLRADRDAAVATARRRALEDAAQAARTFPASSVEPVYQEGYRDGRNDVAELLDNRAAAVASPAYRDVVNAPLTAQTIEAINQRLEAGDMPRRKVASPAREQGEVVCGPTPDHCDGETGEPCANHERQQAHAEGEHAFCGAECSPAREQGEGAAR